jgi:hypothetical protein
VPSSVDLEARVGRLEPAGLPRRDVRTVRERAPEAVLRHARTVVAHVAAVEVPDRDRKALDEVDAPLNRPHRRHGAIVSTPVGKRNAARETVV